jgi:hypothetical protein
MARAARGGGGCEGTPRFGARLTGGADVTTEDDPLFLSAEADARCLRSMTRGIARAAVVTAS